MQTPYQQSTPEPKSKTDLNEALNDLSAKISYTKQQVEEREVIKVELEKLYDFIIKLNGERDKLEYTIKFLNTYKVKQKDYNSHHILSILTLISRLVFPEYPYEYFFKSRVIGENTYTRLLFTDSTGTTLVPELSNGNGLQQTLSVTGVAIITALSNITPTLILDEKLNSLSRDKMALYGVILEYLANLGLQILMIEHPKELFENITYTQIELENVKGKTLIRGTHVVEPQLTI